MFLRPMAGRAAEVAVAAEAENTTADPNAAATVIAVPGRVAGERRGTDKAARAAPINLRPKGGPMPLTLNVGLTK